MKQRLRELLNRSSIYLAVRFPSPLTIALMCRLNEMPYGIAEGGPRLAAKGEVPLVAS